MQLIRQKVKVLNTISFEETIHRMHNTIIIIFLPVQFRLLLRKLNYGWYDSTNATLGWIGLFQYELKRLLYGMSYD